VVFAEPSSIDADGAVTPLGSCFSSDAIQEWSANAPLLANGWQASGLLAYTFEATSRSEDVSATFNRTRCQRFRFYRMT
jgi:hypothetical protein